MSRSTVDSPTGSSALSDPGRLFRGFAVLEAFTWVVLLLGMLGKHVLGLGDAGVKVGGSLHGFAFLCYCLTTVFVAVDRRWRASELVLGLVCSVIPFATWWFERRARRTGLLDSGWRLRQENPRGRTESVVSAALRRPAQALLAAVVLVAVVFAVFIVLGPPLTWFR